MITVMIIDEAESSRDYHRRILEEEGCDVVEARSGEEALGKLDRMAPVDVVILEFQIPDANPRDLIARLKEKASPSPLPVLSMSDTTTNRVLSAALRAGANHYLAKPVPPDCLLNSVTALSGRAR